MAASTAICGLSTPCCSRLRPTKRRSLRLDPSVKLTHRQPASPTSNCAISTLNSSCSAGSRSTVKLRSKWVSGSVSPNGTASSAGNHRLQPRARAVADPASAAASTTRSTGKGRSSSNRPSTAASSATQLGERPASAERPLTTSLSKGSEIRPRAWTNRKRSPVLSSNSSASSMQIRASGPIRSKAWRGNGLVGASLRSRQQRCSCCSWRGMPTPITSRKPSSCSIQRRNSTC